ncbi:MAG: hypothetical protein Kow0092_16640 [Deferrisomatales bacterium]
MPAVLLVLFSVLAWGPPCIGTAESGAGGQGQTAPAEPPESVGTWGLEIVAVRVAAAGHLLDLRYRVADAQKASPLFNSQTKPYLIHQASGKVLAVPTTAKLGPLRSKYKPRQGRVYSMLFANPGLVRPGDRVTWVLGELRVEDVVVE